jgi:hypothetical protein
MHAAPFAGQIMYTANLPKAENSIPITVIYHPIIATIPFPMTRAALLVISASFEMHHVGMV